MPMALIHIYMLMATRSIIAAKFIWLIFRFIYLLPTIHHNRIYLSSFKLNMSVVDTYRCLPQIFFLNNIIFDIWLSTWPSWKIK